ncbi:homoserine kinase [Methylovirgula sp. HY1]|uniref:homoserine kinase n=1 Tax=Methylovirgula sp. HY1 TaxID=2822761 RepID=UPI001C5B87D7|nr:homoserine kinase [Methylovirgula sp. HY1]QXX74437.1 Homoserine kinase [Methylovirgula sp. HY1]
MAVYTEVSDTALQAFLADYDLGRLLAYKGIAEGVENSNFFVHAEAGFFILTLYEKRVAAEDLPFFLGLMEHLAAHGLNCPQPVKPKTGALLGRLAGKPAAIVTFLEGVSSRSPTSRQCAALGESLASLHRAGADFSGHRRNALSLDAWAGLYEQGKNGSENVQAGLADFIAAEIGFLEKAWPLDLPRGVIHADLFPDNVLFLGDTVSGLIDFYFACDDFLAYDLAICLNAWCFELDGSFNITKGMALINAYEQMRRLTPEETAALPILARGAALRFALTRLVDWLNVPPGALVKPKDPLDYVKRLRFHQKITNAREFGLLR